MGGVDLAPITIYIMGLLIAGTLYSKINLRTRFVAAINRGEGGPRSAGMPETGLEVIVQKCLTSSINKYGRDSPPLVHCCTLFLCYLDAEIGYRVVTPYRRM